MKTSIIFLCFHSWIQQWFFEKLTSAAFNPKIIDFEKTLNTDHSDLWNPFGELDWEETKIHLRSYMLKSLKDKQECEPFFALPNLDQFNLPEIKVFQQLNNILRSEISSWTHKLQENFKIEVSYKKEHFWMMIGELSLYMPTSALQVTIIQVEKESRQPWKIEVEGNGTRTDQDVCWTEVMEKCRKVLKEQIGLLKQGRETEKIRNIFTRQEQERLGDYKICLQNDWSFFEEIELYQHILLYNTIQGILETQVILVSLIKLKKRTDLKIPRLVPHEINQVYEKWIDAYIKELTNKLVNSINSLNELQIQGFEGTQVSLGYGLLVSTFRNHTDIKKVTIFWIRYMAFYLEIKTLKDLSYPINYIENLILKDTKHMEYIIKEFQQISMTKPLIPQKNLMTRFLEFFLEKTQAFELRQIALDGLLKIQEIQGRDSLKALDSVAPVSLRLEGRLG